MSSWRNDTWHSFILRYVQFCAIFGPLCIWHTKCISYGEDKNEAVKAQECKTGCVNRFGKEKRIWQKS